MILWDGHPLSLDPFRFGIFIQYREENIKNTNYHLYKENRLSKKAARIGQSFSSSWTY